MRDNGGMNDFPLTERGAARLWALAYNTLDPSVLAPILAEEVRVMSRWVVNDLVGRSAYLDYLARKFGTFDAASTTVRVELAQTPGHPPESGGRPCALVEQDGRLLATVLFDVIGGRLTQVSLSDHPAPRKCVGTGEYPGCEVEPDLVN
jgi:hypothetical protein